MGFNEGHANFEALRSIISESRSPIVFWIGAGVSADAGLPGWYSLRDKLNNAALEEMVNWSPKDADAREDDLVQAANSKDLWKSFGILQNILGYPTYKSIIRQFLEPSAKVSVPELHRLIWNLPETRGVVSLNIDGLEGRAHRSERTHDVIDEFVGRDIENHIHTIQAKKQFIARLHGHHSDSTSWVFTDKELTKIVDRDAYKTSVQALFSNYTIIFVGISADDVAAGGFLHNMTAQGLDSGSHFWITDRVDSETRKWSDSAGLLRINYHVANGENHTSIISSIFKNIAEYKPQDATAIPVVFSGAESEVIPDLSALRLMPEDEVRFALNRYAKHLINEGANRTDTQAYTQFITGFSPFVHQSYHLSDIQGYNIFFGYHAVEKIHGGPFSTVWRVKKPNGDGSYYALKIMQFDNLQKGPQIESFRRGIASQKLLKDATNFDGIAKIEAAFEIPPSVVMEFVEGESLEEVAQKPGFNFWDDGLQIMIEVCGVVSRAHKSKFGILHRDIRPQNIMLPNYYYGDNASDYGLDQFQVKLLNYDLSWHKDAAGRIVPTDPGAAGYFAPELLSEPDSTRAKSASVDTYGIGMTLYRIAAKRAPPPAGSNSVDWQAYLVDIRPKKNGWFRSSHNFLSRLIDSATSYEESLRPLVTDIQSELRDLYNSLRNGVGSANGKLIAENLMYALCFNEFETEGSGHVFHRNMGGYRSYKIEFQKNTGKVVMVFTNAANHTDDWSRIDKAWSESLRAASEILVSGGWKIQSDTSYSSKVLTLATYAMLEDLRSNYDRLEDALKRAVERVKPN